MTKEEAKYQLRNTAWLGTHEDRDRTEKAVEMAISALEQEPCEDAINREDVIALIQCSEYELQDRVDNDAMCDDVRKLPSVQPSRKGHWINNQNGTYTCDKCGIKHSRSNYCPNCGAEMESEE